MKRNPHPHKAIIRSRFAAVLSVVAAALLQGAAPAAAQAIPKEDPKKADEKTCISCMRCIAVCPQGARKVNPVMLSAASLMLKKVCSERKECELFL